MRLISKRKNLFNYFDELAEKIEEGSKLFSGKWHKLMIIPMWKVAKLKEIETRAECYHP